MQLKKRRFTILVALCLVLNTSLVFATDTLARKAFWGIAPDLPNSSHGVVVERVLNAASGHQLGIKTGDVITGVNGAKIANWSDFLEVTAGLYERSDVQVTLLRNEKPLTVSGNMLGRSKETSQWGTVEYGSVEHAGGKLRSIFHKAKNHNNNTPTLMFIQGYTCGSIDMGPMPNASTKLFVDELVKSGISVFRVEKMGVGDSQNSSHCMQVNFLQEVDGFESALNQLKQRADVNSKQVYLFGHSLGVLVAPILAQRTSVTGIIGFGGVAKQWFDYMIDIYDKQSRLYFSQSAAQTKQTLKLAKPYLDAWLNTDLSWQQLLNHEAVIKASEANIASLQNEQILDRHFSFFRQLNQIDFQAIWSAVTVPTLFMHGDLDIQAIEPKWIYDLSEVINMANGKKLASALQIEHTDHAFLTFDDKAEMMKVRAEGQYNPADATDRFAKQVPQNVSKWIREQSL